MFRRAPLCISVGRWSNSRGNDGSAADMVPLLDQPCHLPPLAPSSGLLMLRPILRNRLCVMKLTNCLMLGKINALFRRSCVIIHLLSALLSPLTSSLSSSLFLSASPYTCFRLCVLVSDSVSVSVFVSVTPSPFPRLNLRLRLFVPVSVSVTPSPSSRLNLRLLVSVSVSISVSVSSSQSPSPRPPRLFVPISASACVTGAAAAHPAPSERQTRREAAPMVTTRLPNERRPERWPRSRGRPPGLSAIWRGLCAVCARDSLTSITGRNYGADGSRRYDWCHWLAA